VNNSGVNFICPTLDVEVEQAKTVFDVNFWGLISCTQAFAPLLIAAKGTVINNGSILSLLNLPYSSIYCASKAAITMFGEVLRIEMAPFGVNVVTIITGSVATNINNEGSGFKPRPDSRYAKIEAAINNIAHGKDIPNQMKPKEYAEKVVGDILGGASGKIWRGGSATAVRYLFKFLPQFIIVDYYYFLHVILRLTFH
jgi:1-acylglycerone phosphate reductase